VNVNHGWQNPVDTKNPRRWVCWFCEEKVGGIIGYSKYVSDHDRGDILICPVCGAPTYFPDRGSSEQAPKPLPGNKVSSLSSGVEELFAEMRTCIAAQAYTAAVLVARKTLMHIAVDLGASPGKKFIYYVKYLADNHYVSPGGTKWVDHIRSKGNEANHEIVVMSADDAMLLLRFLEVLLKSNYEFPASLDALISTEEEIADDESTGVHVYR
jgi:hypothetical protein